jgi:transcriptional regulator with XRE-family HTH domain
MGSRLGNIIKHARLAAGVSEKQLGKKCGLAENVIRDIEAGRRIASDEQARQILKKLGAEHQLSTELEPAAEPEAPIRPRPRPYVLQPREETRDREEEAALANDAWRDALGGVVKRVPVSGEDGLVIDHVLTPIVAGKIEGGAPDKVFYHRCPDDALRGYRIHAGDLLLTVPAANIQDEAIMVLQYRDRRIARKVTKQEDNRLLLQSYDREFVAERVERRDVLILGRCVRLLRSL